VEVLGLEDKTGLAGSPTAALDYPGVWVPGDRLVGERNSGGRVMFAGIGITRVGIGGQALGIGKRAFAAAVDFAQQRRQGGRLIIEHPAVAQRLADMALALSAMENLICKVALLESQRQWHVREMSIAKLFCTEALQELTQRAIGVHGGYGCSKDYAVERCRREAVALPLFGGTSEIQAWIITRELLESVAGTANADYRARDRAEHLALEPRCSDSRLRRLWVGIGQAMDKLWTTIEQLAGKPEPEPFAPLVAEAAMHVAIAEVLLRQACGPEAGELERAMAAEAINTLDGKLAACCERVAARDSGAALRVALRTALATK
jgi:hypothetical protein